MNASFRVVLTTAHITTLFDRDLKDTYVYAGHTV